MPSHLLPPLPGRLLRVFIPAALCIVPAEQEPLKPLGLLESIGGLFKAADTRAAGDEKRAPAATRMTAPNFEIGS